jgi:hypothetical protein
LPKVINNLVFLINISQEQKKKRKKKETNKQTNKQTNKETNKQKNPQIYVELKITFFSSPFLQD